MEFLMRQMFYNRVHWLWPGEVIIYLDGLH